VDVLEECSAMTRSCKDWALDVEMVPDATAAPAVVVEEGAMTAEAKPPQLETRSPRARTRTPADAHPSGSQRSLSLKAVVLRPEITIPMVP
jgi:hypothetical protein